jgi:(E)-4-hydroxy-3-methylbut-2-enyl-diphosphate synthase
VKNIDDAQALSKIKNKVNIPLVADIHFNYRLGLEAAARGVDGLRLNPGNIYRREEVKAVARAAKKKGIPIRVGVNSGSIRCSQLTVDSSQLEGLMVKSACDYIKILESFDFYDIIVSLKASDVPATVSAYRKMAKVCDYPFHLGITACGLAEEGAVKSAMGIGSLLLEGIGDTIRVSLTGNPLDEIKTAKQILQSLKLRRFSPEIIACPTCGRTQVDIAKIAKQLRKKLSTVNCEMSTKRPFTMAIMGCEVNGPGEARDADIGVACGRNTARVFKKGKVVKKIPEGRIVDMLVGEIDKLS